MNTEELVTIRRGRLALLEKIEAAVIEFYEAAEALDRCSADYRTATHRYEGTVAALRALCRDAQPGKPTSWESFPVAALDLAPGTLDALASAGIGTIGELCKRMGQECHWWHRGLKGMSELTTARIMDRLCDFWDRHPEYRPKDYP